MVFSLRDLLTARARREKGDFSDGKTSLRAFSTYLTKIESCNPSRSLSLSFRTLAGVSNSDFALFASDARLRFRLWVQFGEAMIEKSDRATLRSE